MRELLILLWKLDYKNLAKTPLSIEIKQDVMLALQYELPKLPTDRRTYATTSKRRTRDKSFKLLACSAPVDDKYCNNNIRDESISQLAGICSRCLEVKELASVWSNFASYPVDQREAAAALLLHNMSWRLTFGLGLVDDLDVMSFVSPHIFLDYSVQSRLPDVILRYMAHLDSSN